MAENIGVSSMSVNAKAGMSGVDVNKVNQIVYEISKNSKYYLHQVKRQEQIEKRIADMKLKVQTLSELQILAATAKVDELVSDLEATRDLSRTIVHIDMDAFYAAVEMRDDPTLKDKPMAVGGLSMLSTSNYHARKFGVRAAMPGFIAKKLCPELIIIPLNFKKYTAASQKVKSVLEQYDPNLSTMSLDEAYLDITDYVASVIPKSSAEDVVDEIVSEIRLKILEKTQLTASAGIAPNSRLAKICSDQNKPNGQFRLKPCRETIMEFVKNLSIRKVNGIGNVSEQMLNGIGVKSCGDLWESRGILSLVFSQTSFQSFLRISLGIGSSHIHSTEDAQKSISVERTFGELQNADHLIQKCEELCLELCEDMNESQLQGKTVTLKLKKVNFDVTTRSKSLSFHTANFDVIFRAAKRLLEVEMASVAPKEFKLRLMGVRMSSLMEASRKASQYYTLDRFLINSASRQQHTRDETIQEMCLNGNPSNEAQSKPNDSNETNIIPGPSQDMRCPVCNYMQKSSNLDDFNSHVDVCLNRNTIRDMLAIPKSSPSCNKRAKSKESPSNRKRKCSRQTDGVTTLDRFFKL